MAHFEVTERFADYKTLALPTLEVSQLNSVSTSQALAPTQITLSDSMQAALSELGSMLKSGSAAIHQQAGKPIQIQFSEQDKGKFIASLVGQIEQWYFSAPDQLAYFQSIEPKLSELLVDVADHLNQVADKLRGYGYNDFWVNLTHNSFADELHLHKYCSYILYIGRENGTELLPGQIEENGLYTFCGRNDWNRNPQQVFDKQLYAHKFLTADVDKGLILPPNIAHRAPKISFVDSSKVSANLAVVLLAFKNDERIS